MMNTSSYYFLDMFIFIKIFGKLFIHIYIVFYLYLNNYSIKYKMLEIFMNHVKVIYLNNYYKS